MRCAVVAYAQGGGAGWLAGLLGNFDAEMRYVVVAYSVWFFVGLRGGIFMLG